MPNVTKWKVFRIPTEFASQRINVIMFTAPIKSKSVMELDGYPTLLNDRLMNLMMTFFVISCFISEMIAPNRSSMPWREQGRHILRGISMDSPPKEVSSLAKIYIFIKRRKVLKVKKNGFRHRNRISKFGHAKDMACLQDVGVSS